MFNPKRRCNSFPGRTLRAVVRRVSAWPAFALANFTCSSGRGVEPSRHQVPADFKSLPILRCSAITYVYKGLPQLGRAGSEVGKIRASGAYLSTNAFDWLTAHRFICAPLCSSGIIARCRPRDRTWPSNRSSNCFIKATPRPNRRATKWPKHFRCAATRWHSSSWRRGCCAFSILKS